MVSKQGIVKLEGPQLKHQLRKMAIRKRMKEVVRSPGNTRSPVCPDLDVIEGEITY